MNNSFFYENGKLRPTGICVPLEAENIASTITIAKKISRYNPELIEWRVDSLWDYHKDIKAAADALVAYTKEIPLLFTWRSERDGGRGIDDRDYDNILIWAIESELFQIVDIELSVGREKCREFIDLAQNHSIDTVISYHDFLKTPSFEQLTDIFEEMQNLGATAGKIAVMPENKFDVLRLIEANLSFKERHPEYPTVAISMGELGMITRTAGEFCQSAFTFASVTGASAPGQLDIKKLRKYYE